MYILVDEMIFWAGVTQHLGGEPHMIFIDVNCYRSHDLPYGRVSHTIFKDINSDRSLDDLNVT